MALTPDVRCRPAIDPIAAEACSVSGPAPRARLYQCYLRRWYVSVLRVEECRCATETIESKQCGMRRSLVCNFRSICGQRIKRPEACLSGRRDGSVRTMIYLQKLLPPACYLQHTLCVLAKKCSIAVARLLVELRCNVGRGLLVQVVTQREHLSARTL